MKANDNWNNLDDNSKIKVIESVIKNKNKKLMSYPNVIAIGVGRKEKKETLLDNLCLKFSVKRKWSTNRRKVGLIPDFCLTSFEFNSQGRQFYAVPTDVSVLKTIKLQGGVGGTTTVSRRHGHAEIGTACCYVKFHGYDEFYLLGCAHTFALIKRFNISHDLSENITFKYDYSRNVIAPLGHLQQIADLNWADAAVVYVTDYQDIPRGYGPGNITFSGALNNRIPFHYVLHAKSGSFNCEWVQTIKEYDFTYHTSGSPAVYTMKNLIVSRILGGSTRGGDSGSPLVSHDGFLISMHIAGGSNHSYSLPIMQVFNAFNPPIYLIR
ncbi:hypothetical protein HRH59_19080 [Rheinheimera sp. YQF-2]|uniref:Serine protease n=1 Tax=Rheinheimera lutimaris TaxID=2740584 RepID=A0A7Y5AUE6_9GAMM|nr:hypothetical protein [Rheinheimera lutimaris]NRQ44643.1 hypothetical protein [Rheinheimera lutimaris]